MSLLLEVVDVVKCFCQGSKKINALNGVSLDIQKGEFVAIMGASGSGKSTLLHAMAGLTDVDQGRILINSQDLSLLNDNQLTRFRKKNIGLVFQAFNLIPILSAEDNVRLPAFSEPDISRKVDDLLELLGMTDRKTHKPDALSGGEQQRVAIARALIADPAIMLVDEPTGNLDSIAGEQICTILRRLCDEQGCTIVMVTHEPVVASYSDRIVILKDGRIIDYFDASEFSDVQTLSNRYQTAVLGNTQTAGCAK